jgi:hypothetical protein
MLKVNNWKLTWRLLLSPGSVNVTSLSVANTIFFIEDTARKAALSNAADASTS